MLSMDTLKDKLKAIFEGAAGSGAVPPTEAATALDWAAAMNSYAGGLTTTSSALAAAVATLGTALAGFGAANAAVEKIKTTFGTFGVTLAGGVTTPTPAPLSAPPTATLDLASVFAQTYSSAADAAGAIAKEIDTWMRTGGPGWS